MYSYSCVAVLRFQINVRVSRGFISQEQNVCLCNDNNDICNCIMTIATFRSIDAYT